MSPETVGLVPPGVVTVTSTAPDPAGPTALICPELKTENDVAGVEPVQKERQHRLAKYDQQDGCPDREAGDPQKPAGVTARRS
jgi:hypothetical protein